MSTGTIQDAAKLVITDLKHDALQFGYTNSQGAKLEKGDEVYLHTDGSVRLRGATQIPLGIVVVGAEDGERVTVRTYFTAVMDVVNNNAGTVNAGVLMIPQATKDANGIPNYDIAAATNQAVALTLTSVGTTEIVRVGILDSIMIAV